MQTRITSVGLLITPDPADLFTYPHHIDCASLDALPSRPGIYIFRDAKDRPLYIGKSVNIRSRVLSHLRAADESRMLQQSAYVEFRRTAGEIGALLLEAQLIKALQPLHNKLLRRTREMCALRLEAKQGAVPEIVYARDHDFSTTDGLFGLFATRKAALEKLREIVDAEKLCPVMTGLETPMRGRPCFARQISRCRGACVGEESAQDHANRLRSALERLRIVRWPYGGPIGIVEACDDWQQTHVIDHWVYRGSIDNTAETLLPKQPGQRVFDVDTYKILVKPILQGQLQLKPLNGHWIKKNSL